MGLFGPACGHHGFLHVQGLHLRDCLDGILSFVALSEAPRGADLRPCRANCRTDGRQPKLTLARRPAGLGWAPLVQQQQQKILGRSSAFMRLLVVREAILLVLQQQHSKLRGACSAMVKAAMTVRLLLAFPAAANAEALPSAAPPGGSALGSGGQEALVEEVLREDDSWTACVSAALGRSASSAVVEPKTKVEFPAFLTPPGGDSDAPPSGSPPAMSAHDRQVLAGVGVRGKNLMVKSLSIYAFGLYVEPAVLRAELGEKYAGIPPAQLKVSDEFFKDLLSRELGMTVRLVVHYKGLSRDMVRKAFETSLKNRLRKYGGGDDEPGLLAFSRHFSQPMEISRGTIIDVRWQKGGCLSMSVSGKAMDTIVSAKLCRAFFDLYIGEPPVSPRAKQEIGEAFAKMLTAC